MSTFIYIGGGTAGHIFPGQAIAERNPTDKHIFITDTRGVAFIEQNVFDKVLVIKSNRRKIFTFIWQTVVFLHQLKKQEKISGVFLLGGLITVLPGLFAFLFKIPCCIIETNAIMGKANRLLAKFIKNIYTTFDLQHKKAIKLGFFVRQKFINNQKTTNSIDKKSEDTINILIIGSSIGANFFAKHLPQALFLYKQSEKKNLKIVQQAPKNMIEELTKEYENMNVKAQLLPFIHDVPEHMSKADLIICRAGASSISEGCMMGKKMLMVPYKQAADDHQKYNALEIEKLGMGKMIFEDDFNPADCAKIIKKMLEENNSKIYNNDAALSIWSVFLYADFDKKLIR